MWAYNKDKKSVRYCLIKQKRLEKVQWLHDIIFAQAHLYELMTLQQSDCCASTWAPRPHFKLTLLSACVATDTLQIRGALTLWCTDALCHIGAMNYGHCGPLIGFQGLAALNLDSLKTASLRTSGFMYHGPFNKSKTKVCFFQFYWIVNLVRNTKF